MREYLHYLADVVRGRRSDALDGEAMPGAEGPCALHGERPVELHLPMQALPALTGKVARGVAPWYVAKVGFGGVNGSVREVGGEACLVVQYPRGSIAPSCAKKGAPLGGLGIALLPTTALTSSGPDAAALSQYVRACRA